MTLTKFAELSLSEIEELMKESGGFKKLCQELDILDGNSKLTAGDRAEKVKNYLHLRGPFYFSGVIWKKINRYGIWFIHSFSHKLETRNALDIAFDNLDNETSVTISLIFDCDRIDEIVSCGMYELKEGKGVQRVDKEKSLLWYRDHPGVYNNYLVD